MVSSEDDQRTAPVPALASVLAPILAIYQRDPLALVQILREVQRGLGHLAPGALTAIADALKLSRAHVEGVAGFYSFLHTEPVGRYRVLFSDNITDRMLGNMALHEGSLENCAEGDQSSTDPLIEVPNGGTVRNVIFGSRVGDGIHCLGSCTIENVWFQNVCDDAISVE